MSDIDLDVQMEGSINIRESFRNMSLNMRRLVSYCFSEEIKLNVLW